MRLQLVYCTAAAFVGAVVASQQHQAESRFQLSTRSLLARGGLLPPGLQGITSHPLSSSPSSFASDSDTDAAWAGQTTAGSATTRADGTPFTPFWVPFGARAVDSASHEVRYSPASAWRTSRCSSCIGGSIKISKEHSAKAKLVFEGRGVEVYGTRAPEGGRAEIWIDGKRVAQVDSFGPRRKEQQRLWGVDDLPSGRHAIEVVALGTKQRRARGTMVELDAFVVVEAPDKNGGEHGRGKRTERSAVAATPKGPPRQPHLSRHLRSRVQQRSSEQATLHLKPGSSGVNAMQFAVIDDTHAILVDKVEHNPLEIDGHPAWAATYNLDTGKATALRMGSNSFCAGGTFLSNGTLINIGGNPVVSDLTGSADFGDVDGLQAIRLFGPCEQGKKCEVYDDPARLHMQSSRWYASVVRLDDGSAMIVGGSKKGGWINNATVNNPTVEFFPPKHVRNTRGPIHVPFLDDSLPANLFPFAIQLPNGLVFLAAGTRAALFSWRTGLETRRLPDLPNNVAVTYPVTGSALLLPLSPKNDYTPEVLICGGSDIDLSRPSWEISSNDEASSQCVRMVLEEEGIQRGWQVEHMPERRVMPDLVGLPDGKVLIVNGAGSGIGGYGNVRDRVGQSNAANPVLQPVMYDPEAPAGARFSAAGLPSSDIARMYHSVASLVPSGGVVIAGSNPNLDRAVQEFRTEYRVEELTLPYSQGVDLEMVLSKSRLSYGKGVAIEVKGLANELAALSAEDLEVEVALMDLGFVTHSVHMNSRHVVLNSSIASKTGSILRLSIDGPPSKGVYPPGFGWLYVVLRWDGGRETRVVRGKRVMVGDGNDPPSM